MKTIYTILLTIAFFAMDPVANAQNFYLHSNGVTCMCPNAAVGDTGVVNGVTYTKRTSEQITHQNAATTCTSGITDMSSMFYYFPASSFNGDISSWDTSNVTDMAGMFHAASSFNQHLNGWDVSNVFDMNGMFFLASSFNQPLNNWDVSNVIDMDGMFFEASSFNQPLNNWDVSNVFDMAWMFYSASSFNQPLNGWDVSNVFDMEGMFYDATSFNQDISGWCVVQIPTEPDYFAVNCPLQQSFKPQWGATCSLSTATVNNPQIDIKLYPNPTRDVFILDNQSEHSIETITILNMQGQVVKQVDGTQANTQQINIQDLASSNYFIQIETNKANLVKRLIKN